MLSQYKDILNNVCQIANRKSQLEEYLMSQDLEAIKVIETVMYIGRDTLKEDPSFSINDIYTIQRGALDISGWRNKSIEIDEITKKAPLKQYMKAGIQILKVND